MFLTPMTTTKPHLIGNKHRLGKEPWNKGKKGVQVVTQETRNKQSIVRKGKNNGMYKHGLSANGYLKRKEILAGRDRPVNCEVCYESGQIDFDHCHVEDKFRGWICRRCNLVLGMVKDSQRLLRNLALYIDINYDVTRPTTIINGLLSTNNSNEETPRTE